MATDRTSAEIRRVASRELHFQKLRPGQEEAIRALVKGRDTLVVQPTGSGKSAIYQIAAMMSSGAALVVSPLIALQKDQIDALEGNAEAAQVNSQQSESQNRETLEKAEAGDVDFLFLAPEQFRRQETLQSVQEMDISLFAVDEAHCISEWGHDFRPDYLALGQAIEALGHPTVVALTATASPDVREEIVARLGMRDPQVLVSGFDRPNISLEVHHATTEAEKEEALLNRVRWSKLPGIVYCATRQRCEDIAKALGENGFNAVVYHAGLRAKDRTAIQDRFMSGETDIIVATNAFGMGIDKPDIRFVFHADVPESLDAYYQQIGRAGRDGEPAEAVLFFRPEDMGIRKFQTGGGRNNDARLRKIIAAITATQQKHSDRPAITVKDVAEECEFSARQISNSLRKLQDVGAIDVSLAGEISVTGGKDLQSAVNAAAEHTKRHTEHARKKLLEMQTYADLPGCRREFLLNYFGDSYRAPCRNCDNCKRSGDQPAGVDGGTRREVTAE